MSFIFFMDLLFYIIIKFTQKQYFQFDYLKKQKEEITKNCREFLAVWKHYILKSSAISDVVNRQF